jgi:nitric oxide reductase subunit C
LKTNLFIFLLLSVLFIVSSISIYLQPFFAYNGNSAASGSGRLVWQKYNCQSCHQLYGLGGYLGPDLTNIMSQEAKGDQYVLGVVRGGTQQMPSFLMTKEEELLLLAFLRAADVSGIADPRHFHKTITGMIQEK